MAVERDWIILDPQAPERDWLRLDQQPCARCLELEAEVLRLSDAILLTLRVELSQSINEYLSDEVLRLQIEQAGRGPPQKQGEVHPRTKKRRREKVMAKVREVGVGGTTFDDMLLALKGGRPPVTIRFETMRRLYPPEPGLKPKRHTEG